MKKLIVNADDFGLDAGTVEWTVRGFECGALTSASIMAGMPFTDMAVAWAKVHPEFSFGVHLYLVDERPLSAAKDIPSMVDPRTGKLWTTRQFILRSFAGLIRASDLLREMSAQYFAIAATGLPVSHVDGHGHNHRLPQSIRALRALAAAISSGPAARPLRVRRCQDLFCGKPGLLSRVFNGPMQRCLSAAGFVMTDHFAMNAGHSDDPQWFSHLLTALPDGITEIGVHPGNDEPWRQIDTTDCFAARDWSGIERITYNDL